MRHPLWNPYDVPSPEQIAAARVRAHAPEQVIVTEYDPVWADWAGELRERIVAALGDRVLALTHVGSTSVPGLAAKPLIDLDLTVADSADEPAWLPDLEAVGFVLRVREPEWEEHRVLRSADPAANLHVWSPGSREVQRHVMFRDWLRAHPADRAAYAQVKTRLAAEGFTDAMEYNNAKAGFIYDLYEEIFAADRRHPHSGQPRSEIN